jgi:hypothetical protein
MFFLFKVFVSALIIASASQLAEKKTILAGFLVALPLTSMLVMIFTYLGHRDMSRIGQLAASIAVATPLSLVFFAPFLLDKWLKLNFAVSFSLGIALLFLAYLVHSAIFKS